MTAFWENPRGAKGIRLRKAFSELGWSEKEARDRLCIDSSRLAAMLHGAFDTVTGDVIVRMANAGIDVQYVLTGIERPAIKADEGALLDNYRSLTQDRKDTVGKTCSAFAQQIKEDDAKSA